MTRQPLKLINQTRFKLIEKVLKAHGNPPNHISNNRLKWILYEIKQEKEKRKIKERRRENEEFVVKKEKIGEKERGTPHSTNTSMKLSSLI